MTAEIAPELYVLDIRIDVLLGNRCLVGTITIIRRGQPMVTHGVKQTPLFTTQTTTFRVLPHTVVTAERHSDNGVPADVLVCTVTRRILPPVLIPLYKSPTSHI